MEQMSWGFDMSAGTPPVFDKFKVSGWGDR